MPRGYSTRAVLKMLWTFWFKKVSQKGSHLKLKNGKNTVIVPIHSKDIPYGTFCAIIQQAGLSLKDAEKEL